MGRFLLLLAGSVVGAQAHAEIVATCGASRGYGYYIPKGIVETKDSGWTEDAISGGSFQLIRSGVDWDVIFTDASGGTLSSRADGGQTSGSVTPGGDIVVQVVYPSTIETYVFWLSLEEPVVTWSQAKAGSFIPKHSLLVAPCARP